MLLVQVPSTKLQSPGEALKPVPEQIYSPGVSPI